MNSFGRRKALGRESTAEGHIPYTAHVAERVVKTRQGDYVQAFRLGGASFETADDEQLNNWHERLNVLWRNIARESVVLWTHVIRHRDPVRLENRHAAGFARNLKAKYLERLGGETLMVNELYISVVYRPAAGLAVGAASRFFSKSRPAEAQLELKDSLDTCEKLAQTLLSSLARYEPQALGVYEWQGRQCSSLLEFFAQLVNGEWQRVALPCAPIAEVLTTTRPLFGFETIEYRTPTRTCLGAMLGVIEYSTPTVTGAFDALLSTPFPWVLTQSFAFLKKASAQALLQRQYNRMQSAADFAVSQAEELRDALDELTSSDWVMGEHHLSLQVLTELIGHGDSVSRDRHVKVLNDSLAHARTLLTDHTGMTIGREDLAIEAAFWAQLPGNFAYRPRKAPITSRNFAAMASFHNFPSGRSTGNHWGEALTLFVTAAGTPYYFSYHASDPLDLDGGTKKDIGHALIIGPTGSGKTALIAFTLCELQAFGVTSVLFTKDRDTEICIRALGGQFYPIQTGIPTGWNPFQLTSSAANLQFLNDLVRRLVSRADRPLSITEENELTEAIRSVMSFEPADRRLGRVLDYLDSTDSDGVYVRLKQWCHARRADEQDGSYAWVFDNRQDLLIDSLGGALTTGFDVTEFLDKPIIRTPINMYLFHLTEQLIDGRRFALFIAEFWKALDDEYFGAFAKDQLKTIRKKNGFVVLDSQSPSDAIKHPHSRTLIEQTPTKICFPNPDATLEDYATDAGLNLTEREFRLIKQDIPTGSRLFLVKQGHNSVVAKLDLKGFDAELDVLSARKATIERMHRMIEEYGEEPGEWLPPFMGAERG
ncbi:MAG: VirB4 family type IV secretion/conjugal transfer ATPase [Steroidobacteraceae bacterium]